MITLYSFPYLMGAVLYALLGFYIVIARQGSPGVRAYAIWCLFTVYWQASWGILFNITNEAVANILLRIGYSGIIFLPIAYYHFVVSFLRMENQRERVAIFYTVGTAFVATVWLTHSFVSGRMRFPWGYFPQVGWLHPIYLVFLTFLIVYAFRLLFASLRSERDAHRQQQIKWVIFASFAYLPACLDFIPNYGIDMYPFGMLFTLLSLSIVFYAILKHRLMEINLVIRQTVVYSLITAILAAVMLFVGMLSARLTQGLFTSHTIFVTAITALLIAAIFHPLQMKVQSFVDKHLFPGWKDREVAREIAAGFSHELKSPLATLSMQAQMTLAEIKEVRSGKRKARDLLPKIEQDLARLVNQALEAARRIEAVRGVAEPAQGQAEPVQVSAVVERCLNTLKLLIEEAHVVFRQHVPPNLPSVQSNPKQLEIVFTNLMKNGIEALKSVHRERILTVSAWEQSGAVLVSVGDNGTGIKSENRARLFAPYFSTKGSQGTGMGLYLSRQIITAYGGSIEVNSDEGKGTEFIVRLPCYSGST